MRRIYFKLFLLVAFFRPDSVASKREADRGSNKERDGEQEKESKGEKKVKNENTTRTSHV